MKTLDYLRQAKKYINKKLLPFYEHNSPMLYESTKEVLKSASKAVKFILPEGGRIIDDDLAALPNTVHLPFPEILIEYEVTMSGSMSGGAAEIFGADGTKGCPKRILLARQLKNNDIVINAVFYRIEENNCSWLVEPFQMTIKQHDKEYHKLKDAYVHPFPRKVLRDDLELTVNYGLQPGAEEYFDPNSEEWLSHAYANLSEELRPILELVEALSCSNVGYERVKRTGMSAVVRGSLPYDDYYTLVIRNNSDGNGECKVTNTSHRSPREHLRRGHIRTYSSGKKIWIQSVIVNAGVGGKIIKDYAIQ